MNQPFRAIMGHTWNLFFNSRFELEYLVSLGYVPLAKPVLKGYVL